MAARSRCGSLARVLKLDPDALCPLCRDPDAQLKYRLTKLRVYACPSCGLVYLWPQLSESAEREMFSRLYRDGESPLPELEGHAVGCQNREGGATFLPDESRNCTYYLYAQPDSKRAGGAHDGQSA